MIICMTLSLYRQIIRDSFWKITRGRYVKKAWYNLGYLIISNYSRWRIRQREVEQKNCAIHRDINHRRGRHSTANMSIALAALEHDPRRIHRRLQGLEGTRVTLYGKQGWSNLAVFFFLFFFTRGSFALDAFASVRVVVRKLRCVFTRLMRLVRSSDEWAADRSIDPLSPIG